MIFTSKWGSHDVTCRVRRVRPETLALVIVVCAPLCLQEIVGAATMTADLPDLLGVYNPSSFREEIFDLGVEFSEVTEASLSITFSASTGVFESCSGLGCTPVAEDLFPGLVPFLRNPLDFFAPSATGSSATDLIDVNFEFFWRPSDLDRLLDGSDHVAVALNGIVCIPENTCFFSTQPTATITGASLAIKGAVVPAPSSLGLVATGLLGLIARASRLRRYSHPPFVSHEQNEE